jgi:signal transduction histidine kinase
LGLAIAAEIARIHGSRIELSDPGIGQGTVVTLFFDRAGSMATA